MAVAILPEDDLPTIAFKVCTALHLEGSKVVLTGGSAATLYAPHVYQSRDADFIVYTLKEAASFRRVLGELGFEEKGRGYAHPAVPITLDFPDEEIRIGSELVDRYDTLHRDGLLLHVLTPTDSVRDRLASFFWYRDRSALYAACGVAKAQAGKVDLAEVEAWAQREGEEDRYRDFIERLSRLD